MKSLSPLAVAFAVLLTAAQAMAALPNQPYVVPSEGDIWSIFRSKPNRRRQ